MVVLKVEHSLWPSSPAPQFYHFSFHSTATTQNHRVYSIPNSEIFSDQRLLHFILLPSCQLAASRLLSSPVIGYFNHGFHSNQRIPHSRNLFFIFFIISSPRQMPSSWILGSIFFFNWKQPKLDLPSLLHTWQPKCNSAGPLWASSPVTTSRF